MQRSPPSVDRAVAHYESFINDVVKENLRRIDLKLQCVNAEVAEFAQIKKTLELLREQPFADGFKTRVDVGRNFFVDAKVEDTSKYIMYIGCGTYLEFAAEEACKYAEARVEALEAAAANLRRQSAEAKAHVKLMLFGIGELQNVRADAQES